VTISTNSDGFRDDEYPTQKSDKRRIVFLGDSLTLGWGVGKEETFEHILEQKLDVKTPTEIINLGVGNYNTTQEVNLFIDKGAKYKPDLVVLFYFINDAEPLPRKSRFPSLGYFRFTTFYWSRIKALQARLSNGSSYKDYYSALYQEGSEGWEQSKSALLQLKELSREHKFDLKVIILPELHELVDYAFEREHALLAEFMNQNGIEHLDLAPFFQDQNKPYSLWVSMDDAHPNALAHGLIAKYALDFISGEARNP
jgi:lysophospholipase L1-like esterase